MDYIRRPFDRLKCPDHARKAARAQLKAAKHTDQQQYLTLAANYIDLAQTFLACSLNEATEDRSLRITRLFTGLWQNLRYAERLSDFEFMLGQALIDSCPEESDSAPSPEPLIGKLQQLPPQSRFAILADACANWPLRWIALAMRTRNSALHRQLCKARCALCQIEWDSLPPEEQNCLVAISAALDQNPNIRTNQALSQRTQSMPRVMQIKAQWLELRSEMVELRLRQTPAPNIYQQLLTSILRATTDEPMQRPALVDRMLNTVHFSRHETIKVS
jgi:hypothetical protein